MAETCKVAVIWVSEIEDNQLPLYAMTKAKYLGLLNTPPIWEDKQFNIQQFEFPSLDLHSFHPRPIPGNIRLGHQMEYVFKQLVEHSSDYQVLVHNLPIREGERTLGEIDFILEDTTNDQLVHVELTYKFYLIDPAISEPIHRLIGPNRRDQFFAKMEKFKNKQFPLTHSPVGAKALSDKQIDHLQLVHQCCFKAQLFYPYNHDSVDIGPLNRACLAGYWLRLEAFNTAELAKAQYYMPLKSEWVIEPNDQVTWKAHADIMIDLHLSLLEERAPMIWVKKGTTDFEKLFVVWW